jgi:hypothetical protein
MSVRIAFKTKTGWPTGRRKTTAKNMMLTLLSLSPT